MIYNMDSDRKDNDSDRDLYFIECNIQLYVGIKHIVCYTLIVN